MRYRVLAGVAVLVVAAGALALDKPAAPAGEGFLTVGQRYDFAKQGQGTVQHVTLLAQNQGKWGESAGAEYAVRVCWWKRR